MNTYRSCLLAAVSAFAFTSAQAQSSPNWSPATGSTGTILKQEIRWTSKVPLNKTYAELTPEQKAELHKAYETLAPGDEPPFPAEGIKPIFTAIKNAQRVLQARGQLDMKVTVGPDGKAIKVDSVGSVKAGQMTDLAQQVLMQTKYKPAMCHGEPCTMQYRFTQMLKSG